MANHPSASPPHANQAVYRAGHTRQHAEKDFLFVEVVAHAEAGVLIRAPVFQTNRTTITATVHTKHEANRAEWLLWVVYFVGVIRASLSQILLLGCVKMGFIQCLYGSCTVLYGSM